jgi:hypothetical protein
VKTDCETRLTSADDDHLEMLRCQLTRPFIGTSG